MKDPKSEFRFISSGVSPRELAFARQKDRFPKRPSWQRGELIFKDEVLSLIDFFPAPE